jgi:ribosomal protein L11 methyltransferase
MLHALIVVVPAADADALYEELQEAGATGLLLEDADEGSDQESPLFGEPTGEPDEPRYWPRTRIKAYFDTPPSSPEDKIPMLQGRQFTIEPVPADDWVAKTQSQFQPIEITPALWIVPSWHRDAPPVQIPDDAVRIELDPGLAFGTGSHPTTRLCLQWLDGHAGAYRTLLDYGCCSGILAIAARKLGVKDVTGIDIDVQAVTSARQNALINGCDDLVFENPDGLPASPAAKSYDLVVANILSNPLKVLAPLLSGRTSRTLVLSGILARQADEIAAVYAPYLPMTVWRTEEDWVCMVGHRTAATGA